MEPLPPAADAALKAGNAVKGAAVELSTGGHPSSWVGMASQAARTRLQSLVSAAQPHVDASRRAATGLDDAASSLQQILARRRSIEACAASWNVSIGESIVYTGPSIRAADVAGLAAVQNAVNETANAVQQLLTQAARLDATLSATLISSVVPYRRHISHLAMCLAYL